MTTQQVNLIKNSWQLASAYPEATGKIFYETLFELAPETVHLFKRTNVSEQSKKLFAMLSYVIAKLDRLNEIIEEVAGLARRHVKYGVREEHYAIVGQALLSTLERGLGSSWNEELKEAWMLCYQTLSSAMIDAARCEQQEAA